MEKSSHDYQQFIQFLPLISNKSQQIIFENKTYILLIKIYPQLTNEPQIKFILFSENQQIFMKVFNYESFQEYKNNMGFEATWKVFLETVLNAIYEKDNGKIKIERTKEDKKLKLVLIHPITKEVRISGNFEMDLVEENLNEIYFTGLLSIFQEKKGLQTENENKTVLVNELKVKEKDDNLMIQNQLPNNIPKKTVGGKTLPAIKGGQRRKFNSNLINPNLRRGKAKGVQYTVDESEDKKDTGDN